MKKPLEFYFDFLSPYSYLAFQNILNDKNFFEQHNVEVVFYPVTIATIIHHYKTLGPGEILPKRNFLFRDLLRHTKIHGIPFKTPKKLPFNSLYALRLALKEVSGELQWKLIEHLFSVSWGRGEDLGDSDFLVQELNVWMSSVRPDSSSDDNSQLINSWMETISKKEIRSALKNNVEYALSKDVFGLPTLIYEDELFWGNDSMAYLRMKIQGNDPLDQKIYQELLVKHPFP